jgi:CYTH domain-containing protein
MKKIADQRYTWKTIANKYDYLVQKSLRTTKKQTVKARLSKTPNSKLINYEVSHLQNQKFFYEK